MVKKLTEEEIETGLELCKGVTEGPWQVEGEAGSWANKAEVFAFGGDELVGENIYICDANFIVAARELLPYALEELKTLRSRAKLLTLTFDHEAEALIDRLVSKIIKGNKE